MKKRKNYRGDTLPQLRAWARKRAPQIVHTFEAEGNLAGYGEKVHESITKEYEKANGKIEILWNMNMIPSDMYWKLEQELRGILGAKLEAYKTLCWEHERNE